MTNILQYFDQKSRITYKSFGENISIYCSKLSTISSNYSKKVRSTDEHSTDTIEKKLPLEVRSKKKEIEREEEKRNNKKHKYGEYNNVLLKDIELEKLKDKFTDWEAKIKNMDEAIALKGYTYKSHYLAILKWSKNEVVVTEPLEEQLKKQQKAFLEGN